ncbi:hypothetical protein O181_090383 [Austropuccinia psidii MF-1]|uniref:Integrase catalytic domain-containing protein n=1 Tax=Austropuccinia psidii MF-1 TaxID=1389203 RepID=A0A9Q3P6E4_9BASI|nr:hypothetical protein [Austropuccinia psidii MF-1]
MTLRSRLLINTILHECHESIYSGHLSEDRTLVKVKSCAWWPSWRKEIIEYCHTCDRCQKANRSTGKKFGLMIHIQETKSPWEVVNVDWVTELPPSDDKSYNACLVIVDRDRKTPIFLLCHKNDTAMDKALLLWIRDISHTGLFKNIISDTDPKFTSALWTNLHRLFGTKLSFSTAYHPQKDGLAERRIQTLEDMIRSFKKWEKSHKVPDFKVGDLALVSTLNFNNIKVPKKLKYSYIGPFVIFALHGTNAVRVELSGELENKHPTFTVSLIKPYQPADNELFPLRNLTPLTVPPVGQSEDRKIKTVIKERRLRGKNQREYLVRYRNSVQEDEWLEESGIPDSDKLLRRLRHERRPQA